MHDDLSEIFNKEMLNIKLEIKIIKRGKGLQEHVQRTRGKNQRGVRSSVESGDG